MINANTLLPLSFPNEDQLITDLEVSKSFFKEEALMVDDENVRKWMNEDVKKYGLKLAKFETY